MQYGANTPLYLTVHCPGASVVGAAVQLLSTAAPAALIAASVFRFMRNL
jgi:hypothetical protein